MKPCSLTFINVDKIIHGASMFHGHLGPFLVLGLRAGMAAVEVFGRHPFEMHANVETGVSPPRSCFLDGVQYASGCTLGKGNIEVREGSNVSVLFMKGRKRLLVKVRDDVLVKLGEWMSNEELEELALEFVERKGEELFEVRME